MSSTNIHRVAIKRTGNGIQVFATRSDSNVSPKPTKEELREPPTDLWFSATLTEEGREALAAKIESVAHGFAGGSYRENYKHFTGPAAYALWIKRLRKVGVCIRAARPWKVVNTQFEDLFAKVTPREAVPAGTPLSSIPACRLVRGLPIRMDSSGGFADGTLLQLVGEEDRDPRLPPVQVEVSARTDDQTGIARSASEVVTAFAMNAVAGRAAITPASLTGCPDASRPSLHVVLVGSPRPSGLKWSVLDCFGNLTPPDLLGGFSRCLSSQEDAASLVDRIRGRFPLLPVTSCRMSEIPALADLSNRTPFVLPSSST